MTWKISKKQADLKKQLKNSLKMYNQASKALDQMLLKMLHRKGVYTPDDFHRKYIAREIKSDPLGLISTNQPGSDPFNQALGKALTNLGSALIQLKDAIKESASKSHGLH